MPLNLNALENALSLLGGFLQDNNQHYEVVAIGGGSLLLLGYILRPTRDLDLVALVDDGSLVSANPLPIPFQKAIEEVGKALKLDKNWINSAPADLFDMGLPKGFKSRMQIVGYGGLTIYLAGRFDQICFKLYAAVDQGPTSKHFSDLQILKPTPLELEEAAKWCVTHDVSEPFASHLTETLASLGV